LTLVVIVGYSDTCNLIGKIFHGYLGVVYEIPCGNCEHRYTGETKQSLSTRLKEHHRDTLLGNILKTPQKSALTKHAAQSVYAFNWDHAHVLHHVDSYHKRIF